MYFLFFQIALWILASFILGWVAHWFLCCRNKDDELKAEISTDVDSISTPSAISTEPVIAVVDEKWKPHGFASRPDKVDDLKRIKGVGLVIEETLNDLGVYQFTQIAEWDQDNISWVENFLAFPGRVAREDWVNQCATLAVGGTTEFAKRVDKGDVGYNDK